MELGPQQIGSVVIIGAGIGGMQAALDLADSGFMVHLVSKDSAVGGTMAMLDKTFPTGDCAMCMISPRMVENSRHPNIKIHTMAEVTEVSGVAGNFTLKISQKARFVDPLKCTGCGVCEKKCPKKIPGEFDQGLSKRKAIFSLFPQAVPNTRVIDPDHCLYLTKGKCRACEKVCDANAINFEDTPQEFDLKAGAVLLCPGLDTYDPTIQQELGYGRWPNVVTSLQFERILSASGPFQGEIKRPSDGKHPKRIAWIQCVGSRDPHNANPWCSSVCCMYATKQAVIAREHDAEVAPTIFYNEKRTFGKDFDKYADRARDEYNVRYERAMISAVYEEAGTGDLFMRYVDKNGRMVNENFDMVVLSVGLQPRKDALKFAKIFDISTDQFGFPKTSRLSPIETTRPGIFVAGTYQGPKDIPETVVQGSAAAAAAMAILDKSRGKEVAEISLVPEKETGDDEPRVGVIVCHCGINISQTVDVEKVAENALQQPFVAHAETVIYACAPDGQERIKELIKEKGLNRVVVAACTPRTHEPLFQDTIREAGLNKHLFELAGIREHCSWCHMGQNEVATQKAIDIVNMNIAKASRLQEIKSESVPVTHAAMIIGGGIAGMTAALSLAEQGFSVHMVEREAHLGGLVAGVLHTLEGDSIRELVRRKNLQIDDHQDITVHVGVEVSKTEGYVGNFKSTLSDNSEIDHGVVVVASGGMEYVPTEYGFGESDNVLTQRQLERQLAANKVQDGDRFAMIQCVGSREEPHNYCSRICCQDAIKNAIAIKEKTLGAQVVIFYRDIRTYGLRENYYAKARDLGVRFVRYEVDNKPQVTTVEQEFRIAVNDPVLENEISMPADYVILSTGLRPHPTNEKLGEMYKLTRNEDGYFLEAHVKLRPVDFVSEGLFVAGLAHAPKNLDETINQALAAAGRAGTVLSQNQLTVSGIIAKHKRDKCMSCLACFRACPFDSPFIDEDGKISHNEIKCTGCGICAGICPAKAFQVNSFKDDQITAMIDSLTDCVPIHQAAKNSMEKNDDANCNCCRNDN
jgi:heterodisulfide reductase subunit A